MRVLPSVFSFLTLRRIDDGQSVQGPGQSRPRIVVLYPLPLDAYRSLNTMVSMVEGQGGPRWLARTLGEARRCARTA